MDFDAFRLLPVPSKFVFLIRGLPGSGKSTLANILAEAFNTTDSFEADDYFINANGEYQFKPELLGDAHDWCHSQYYRALTARSPCVIVSNTFTQLWEMSPYIELAKEFGYTVQILHCEGNFGSVHEVPTTVINKMKERWEPYEPDDLA